MRFIRGYWKSIVVCIGILYVSIVRDSGISLPSIAGVDKWIHGLMYAMLGITICWDSWKMNIKAWKVMLVWLSFNAIFGVLYLFSVIGEAELILLSMFYFAHAGLYGSC